MLLGGATQMLQGWSDLPEPRDFRHLRRTAYKRKHLWLRSQGEQLANVHQCTSMYPDT